MDTCKATFPPPPAEGIGGGLHHFVYFDLVVCNRQIEQAPRRFLAQPCGLLTIPGHAPQLGEHQLAQDRATGTIPRLESSIAQLSSRCLGKVLPHLCVLQVFLRLYLVELRHRLGDGVLRIFDPLPCDLTLELT
jgi:hypothetical protein